MWSTRALVAVVSLMWLVAGCGAEPLLPLEEPAADAAADLFVGPLPQDSGMTCEMGARECVSGTSFRTCVSAETGGTTWSEAGACEGGAACVGEGECCDGACVVGERVCSEAGVQTCEAAPGQCPRLSAPVACPAGQTCGEGGACSAQCRSECQAGEKLCFPEGSPAYRECKEVAGQAGCMRYEMNEQMCAGGALCTQGACLSQCNHGCERVGAKRCASGQEQECRADAKGCRAWAGTGGRCCNSATLGRDVVQGTCVQVSYASCGKPSCDWATCSNGTWNYCANAAACPADAKFGHAVCQ